MSPVLKGRFGKCGIIMQVTGADRLSASRVLTQSGSDVKVAIVMLRRNLSREAAVKFLKRHRGDLRSLDRASK